MPKANSFRTVLKNSQELINPRSGELKLRRQFAAILGALALVRLGPAMANAVYEDYRQSKESLARTQEIAASVYIATERAVGTVGAALLEKTEGPVKFVYGSTASFMSNQYRNRPIFLFSMNTEDFRYRDQEREKVETPETRPPRTVSVEQQIAPPSVEERMHFTYAMLEKAVESPPGVIAESMEADICLKGNVVPQYWPTAIEMNTEGWKSPPEWRPRKGEPFILRPISFKQLNDRMVVCGAPVVEGKEPTTGLILTDTTRFDYYFGEFYECEEYMLVRENETTEETNRRILKLNTYACGE